MGKAKRRSVSVSAGITALQYEEALAKYAANDAKKCGLESELDEEIIALREQYDGDLNLLVKENGLLEAIIKSYCVHNRESLFVQKKSLETLYGSVGFRTDPPSLKLLAGVKWEDVVEKLQELLPGYIRTVDTANKAKLITDRAVEDVAKNLPLLGIKVMQGEKFFIELKKEEVPA